MAGDVAAHRKRDRKLPQRAAAQAFENPGAAWIEAMRRGDFAAAWDVSDRVLQARDPAARDDPAEPYHLRWVWDGRPFDGQDVLVRCYHGLGDTLQFCRYLAPLRRRVRRLTVEAPRALIPLLERMPGPDRLLPFAPEAPAPQSECDLEIMELAHALRQAPEPIPYLPRPEGIAASGQTGLRVGLCWHVNTGWAPERSVPLPLLAPLARVRGVRLWSLQRGPGAAELETEGAPAVLNKDDRGTDLLETARLVLSLDVVVTIDTMVAHLAGGLGVPVWLLLAHEPDWRWLAGGRDSPWYRNVRKFQQNSPGDWSAPIAELTADLTQLAGGNSLRGT